MLEVLRIQNYALIDDLEVEFRPGFNVLTGETGAGKSIIIGALNLVLGGRASNETVRQDARQAKIDAVFHLDKPSKRLGLLLRQNDIALEDNALFLSRVVTAEGRSRAYVCGSLVPVSTLAEIGDELVDIHGQHEHQSLLRPDRQLDLLDSFAGTDELVAEVGELVAKLRELNKSIAALETDDRERARRIEFLRFEVNEIDSAELSVGEEEALKSRRNLITNAERIFSLASHARALLYDGEENTAIVTIDAAVADLQELARIDERFKSFADQLSNVRMTIDEVASEVRTLTDNLEFDPDELDRLNQRLVLLSDLKRKFGNSIETIMDYRDRSAAEIDTYQARDQRLVEMHEEQKQIMDKGLQPLVQTLSEKRKSAARKLDKQVTTALQELGMKGGRFETLLESAELSLTGADRAEFMLSANVGEKVKPLRQVASGGEISRIMLALKAVFAGADKIPTLIFDEIDAGVGGHIARNVAAKLHELAQSHQTVCITHIAQIAAVAEHHYHVAKNTGDGRTTTTVAAVEKDDRVKEIARLLDGSVSEVSLKHAKALLQEKR